MLVPTKGITPDRALLTVGAQIIRILDSPLTVSQAWVRVRELRSSEGVGRDLPFWWFTLALDVLYALGAVDLEGQVLRKLDARSVAFNV